MSTKRILICSILMAFSILLAAFTSNAQELHLAIATGGTGGGYYPLGGGIAALITDKLKGVGATAQVTAASIENIRLLQKDKCQIGMMTAIPYSYKEGRKLEFVEHEGISTIMSLGTCDVLTITLKDSPIKKMADLKGKRVGVRSGLIQYNNEQIDHLGLGSL